MTHQFHEDFPIWLWENKYLKTNEFKLEQAEAYLKFLEDIEGAATEIELQELRNLIQALKIELADTEQIPFLQELLGLDDEQYTALVAQASEFLTAFEAFSFTSLTLSAWVLPALLKKPA